MSEILDVDLLAFERGSASARRAVVDGVRRSLETGFVYTSHDLSTDLLDTAYGMLEAFFSSPLEAKQRWIAAGDNGQTGYTGLLVERAASSEHPDWKEMLNWSTPIPSGHPLKRRFPTAYPDQVIPEDTVPGITKVLYEFHDTIADLQRRFLRVIAEGIGCHETFFDDMVKDGPTLTRAIRYPPMVEVPGYDGERYSVVQFCHPRPWTVLAPVPSCCTPERPQRFAAISAADALDEVLYEINLVEDARRV